MELYRKVKEIPACNQEIGTKENWISLFESMNLDFDYMLDNGWLQEYTDSYEDRLNKLEEEICFLQQRLNKLEEPLLKQTSRTNNEFSPYSTSAD